MSKNEMIKWLQNLKTDIGQSQHQDLWHYTEMLDEVIDAIEALNEQPKEETSYWIEKNSHTYICYRCGFEQEIYGNLSDYKFCPNCGKKMEGLW